MKANKQEPRIVKSALSDRWFIVTRYRVKEGTDAKTGEKNQYIVATTKYDVTEQMETILAAQEKLHLKEIARAGRRR